MREGRAVGLLDADLLLRDAMFQADPATPVERIMEGPAALVGGRGAAARGGRRGCCASAGARSGWSTATGARSAC